MKYFNRYISLIFMSLLLSMLLLITSVKGDIAECIKDIHCDTKEKECCARVIVEDSSGNYIDSHYCL